MEEFKRNLLVQTGRISRATEKEEEESQFQFASTHARNDSNILNSLQEKLQQIYQNNSSDQSSQSSTALFQDVKVEEEEDSEPLMFHLNLLEKPSNAIRLQSSAPNSEDMMTQMIQIQNPPNHFLSNHSLNEQQRSRMVDWMIEIFEEYNSNYSSFFYSVQIMDKFCQQFQKRLEGAHLHLLGVTSIWLASKLNDVKTLTLQDMVQISHHKLSKNQKRIMENEELILKTLNFQIDDPNLLNFMTVYHLQINQKLGALPRNVFQAYFIKLIFLRKRSRSYLSIWGDLCYFLMKLFRLLKLMKSQLA